jgi:DNA-binding Xre family transcriptional regulator
LDKKQLEQIKTMLSNKILSKEIARHFGVSQATVSMIKNGKAWMHLKLNGGEK